MDTNVPLTATTAELPLLSIDASTGDTSAAPSVLRVPINWFGGS
ncbi:MAG TPA: hypothetical protein VEJ84_22985 [Acidimicrobiales bacterium]|nr:hypothetical protein [Acidimicrobiales bacterium]